MADAIVMLLADGKATFTKDPANSGTVTANTKKRAYVVGPPMNGNPSQQSRWILQAVGTQTDSNSMTAATYRHIRDEGHPTAVAPTDYNYVSLGS